MFFDGWSLTKTSQLLKEIYFDKVDPSTIYHWVMEYSLEAIIILKWYKLNLGNVWVVDETVININGKNVWFWDVIDEKMCFLLASHISATRTIEDVAIVMNRAYERAGKYPDTILSDKLPAYPKGIARIFGKQTVHLQSHGFGSATNTNLIERVS